jgi:hypothetical protein
VPEHCNNLIKIWKSKGKPKKACIDAIESLLALQLELQSRSSDKKTTKMLFGHKLKQK